MKKKIIGKVVKIYWDDASDAAGSTDHVTDYELLPNYNIGEVLSSRLDRINLRHAHAIDDNRVPEEEPDEGVTIPKGCITKIEIYKLDRVITYGFAQRHKRKIIKRKRIK
jgi:hypothetical protein